MTSVEAGGLPELLVARSHIVGHVHAICHKAVLMRTMSAIDMSASARIFSDGLEAKFGLGRAAFRHCAISANRQLSGGKH